MSRLVTEKRIKEWKELRDKLLESSPESMINILIEYCSGLPIGPRSIDYYTPDSWPTPWEILSCDKLCPSTLSILMYYTLKLIPTFNMPLDLLLVNTQTDRFLIPMINNEYLIYEVDDILSVAPITNCTIISNFSNNIKQIS